MRKKYLENFYRNQFKDLALGRYKGVLSYRNLKRITKKGYGVLHSIDTELLIDIFKVISPIFVVFSSYFAVDKIQRDLDSSKVTDLTGLEGTQGLANALIDFTPAMLFLLTFISILVCIVTTMGMLRNLSRGVYYFYESPERVRLNCSYKEYRDSEFLRRYLKASTEKARREFLNSEEGKALLFMLLEYR